MAIVALCLFEFVLHRQSDVFQEFQIELLSFRWMLLVCVAIWCGTFVFLTFSLNDLLLIGLLLIAIAAYFITAYASSLPAMDAVTFLFGATLGKAACFALKAEKEVRSQKSEVRIFLIGLIGLLAFSSWWHLDMTGNFYHGPRWMGLWDNPNIYGMMMSVGLLLAIGLLAASLKSKVQSPKSQQFLRIILFIAAGMMAVGLFFSYSRGAWLGTAIGLLYLAKTRWKFKRRSFLLPAICFLLLIFGIWFFWNTPRTAPWYFQRLDLSRGSVQHRVAAWKADFEIMRDHPFGVGWNKTVEIYEKNYSPPENGAAAITTNDYLMLGTQLGIPALLYFVAYVALRLGVGRWKLGVGKNRPHLTLPRRFSLFFSRQPSSDLRPPSPAPARSREGTAREDARPTATLDFGLWTLDTTQVACHAAVVAMLVEFWFDGGLFELPTATVFWILLELGRSDFT